ncbi:MAG: hypothetical protein LBS09_08470, partial [Bacteroidales bacterium]|nr:hypothetical protein [Bacteroidales bacterium]
MERLFVTALIISVFACTPHGIEQTLKLAGDNRAELEKVMAHYRAAGDEQKLKAAEYLIANMADKFAYEGGNLPHYDVIFHLFDSLYRAGMYAGETLEITGAWDSLTSHYGKINPDDLEQKWDAQTITADYLIRQIDVAFEAWRSSP